MLLTAKHCNELLGKPEKEANMLLWDVPTEYEIGVIPKRLYCCKYMVEPLSQAFALIIQQGLVSELLTWDGCFNIRLKRNATTRSLHSWGVAIDINAAWNRMGKPPKMSAGLVKCFTDAGFDWGGKWTSPDGMHFQLSYEALVQQMNKS
jgi:hypothetical protein